MSEDAEMDELLKEFLIESQENLDRLDRELLVLEKNPTAADALAGIFRTIHTIKGTCGFLGFARLEGVTHVGESLLSLLRDGELSLTPAIMSALLALVDAVRAMLAKIEALGSEGPEEYGSLVEELRRLQNPPPGTETLVGGPAATVIPALPLAGGSPAALRPTALPTPPTPAGAKAASATSPTPAGPHLASPEPATVAEPAAPRGHSVADAYVRVDVALLDKLMNLVGELVLARNQILPFVATIEDQTFSATTQRLNLITTELQSGVMKTRMQPIGNLWEKLPRQVRDLSLSLGKQISIEMEGRDTELDKTIIEAIKDPLTHIVRNCVDHGIESPERRLKAGKNPQGRLLLRAFHEGGQVNIEISDDGAGLDVERIRAKAVERGLVSAEQAVRLVDREVFDLVFLPGFSTADKVSNVSGRGVGMDVVKTNVERIGGFVDLHSRAGLGTTFRIKIPLTLAIIPALVVSSGSDRYAIPQISLVELVRLEGDQVRERLDHVHGAPVYRLRGNLLPLVFLNRELGLAEARHATELLKSETVNIVVLQADKCRFGLVVDDINDTEEIVVKPLGKYLKGISAFAGATIMGDGRVALILDVLGLAQRAKIMGESADRNRLRRFSTTDAVQQPKSTLLLCCLADGRPMAVPLSVVARLEVLAAGSVEALADYHVVQYRGEVMPIIDLESLGSGGSQFTRPSGDTIHVVVYGQGSRHVGVAVGRILDIVEEHVVGNTSSPGILGCAVIQNRATEIVDLDGLLKANAARFLSDNTPILLGAMLQAGV